MDVIGRGKGKHKGSEWLSALVVWSMVVPLTKIEGARKRNMK